MTKNKPFEIRLDELHKKGGHVISADGFVTIYYNKDDIVNLFLSIEDEQKVIRMCSKYKIPMSIA